MAPVQIAEPLGVRKSCARGEGKESGPWQGEDRTPLPLHPQLLMQSHTVGAESVQWKAVNDFSGGRGERGSNCMATFHGGQ